MRAMRADGARTDRLLVCGGNAREALDAVIEMQCCPLAPRGRATSTSWQPRWIQKGAQFLGYALFSSVASSCSIAPSSDVSVSEGCLRQLIICPFVFMHPLVPKGWKPRIRESAWNIKH